MLLTGVSMEKQFTQALVAISPAGTSGPVIARKYRGARWMVGSAPVVGIVGLLLVAQLLNISAVHWVQPLGLLGLLLLPLSVFFIVRSAYASARLKAPPLATRIALYVSLFITEAFISFVTLGLFGIASAFVGLVVFLARAFTPPTTPMGPERWSPPSAT